MKIKISTLLNLLLCFILLACAGGGTSGTGGISRQISGVITNKAGQKIADVTVTIIETGENDKSNSEGKYRIATTKTNATVNIKFEGTGIDDEKTISDIPESSRVVDADFEFDEESGDVVDDDVTFSDDVDDDYCFFFPEDPDCFDEEFCLEFPDEPECSLGEDFFEDDFCFEFPEDPTCSNEDDFFEDDFCIDFPDDPTCLDDTDDDFFDDDFCLDFPDDPSCTLDDDFSDDDFCFEFPDDPSCFGDDDFFDDDFCFDFPDDPSCF